MRKIVSAVFISLLLASINNTAIAQSRHRAWIDRQPLASTRSVDTSLSGVWVYRSYRSKPDVLVGDAPDPAKAALGLLFGEGVMTLQVSGNVVQGTFDMGDGYVLELKGTAQQLQPGGTMRLDIAGLGRAGSPTADWEYDYVGFVVPEWSNGTAQIPSFVGTVIRAKPHDGAPAGYVASFISVKRP